MENRLPGMVLGKDKGRGPVVICHQSSPFYHYLVARFSSKLGKERNFDLIKAEVTINKHSFVYCEYHYE
ncbi:hypothetical protein D3C73_561620 [compost metagenome]